MTTPPTTDLPAGPEMDLEVAKACGVNYMITHGIAQFRPDGTRWHEWSPSTNIADAFEALGVMRLRGWRLARLADIADKGWASRWSVTLRNDGDRVQMPEVVSDTLELSICRAIVRAGKGGGG